MEFKPDVLFTLLQKDFGMEETLPLTSDLQISEARKSAMLGAIFKKWLPTEKSSLSHLEQKAIATFLQCNAECSRVQIQPIGFVGEAINLAKESISRLYESGPDQSDLFGISDFLNAGKCGPGSSVGTKRTDYYGKMFNSSLTSTSVELHSFYRTQLSPRWKAADDLRATEYGMYGIVRGSQLFTVRKNRETDRTCGKEASLNMFFQLGAGACVEQLLMKGHNIDLSLQPNRNKAMAKEGSVTGKFATIDLRSASDTISTTLVQYLLPRRLFALLNLIRSKEMLVNDEWVELHMFSSMGNGFTFPLQTLIFAALVRAAYQVLGIKPRTKGLERNYSVFGDDIICLKEAYHFVCQILESCGFHVNDTKSFHVGSFRESCGGDYFKGFDVRAVYLKEVNQDADLYSAFNRLSRWSAKYGIYCGGSLSYLGSLAKHRPVPFDEQDTAGFKVPSCRLSGRKRDANGAIFYTACVAVPRVLKIDTSGTVGENPDGAIICNIGGFIRNNQIGIRTQTPKWKVKRRKTPQWDYLTDAGLTIRDYEDALFGVFKID